MKTKRLQIDSIAQYESAVTLMCFLDEMGLKHGWKASRAVMKRHGDYWERCSYCEEALGEHDEPCYDNDGERRRQYDEDYYRDR